MCVVVAVVPVDGDHTIDNPVFPSSLAVRLLSFSFIHSFTGSHTSISQHIYALYSSSDFPATLAATASGEWRAARVASTYVPLRIASFCCARP